MSSTSTSSQFNLIFLFLITFISLERTSLVYGLKCYACSWPLEKWGQNGKNCSYPAADLLEECKPASTTECPPYCSTTFRYKKLNDTTPMRVGRLCINYPLDQPEEDLKKIGHTIVPACNDISHFPPLKLEYFKQYYEQNCMCKTDGCNSAVPSNPGPSPSPVPVPVPVPTPAPITPVLPPRNNSGLKCYSCNFFRKQWIRDDGWRQKDCHSPTDEDLIDCTNPDGSPSYCMTFVAYEKPTVTGQPTFYLTRDCWVKLYEDRLHKMCDITQEPVSDTIVYTQIEMYHHECICNTTGCNGAVLPKAANVTYV